MMEESLEKENIEPPTKRRRLSLSLPKDRFDFTVDDDQLKQAMKTYCGKNTEINNKWALKNFEEWYSERKKICSLDDDNRTALDIQ